MEKVTVTEIEQDIEQRTCVGKNSKQQVEGNIKKEKRKVNDGRMEKQEEGKDYTMTKLLREENKKVRGKE